MNTETIIGILLLLIYIVHLHFKKKDDAANNEKLNTAPKNDQEKKIELQTELQVQKEQKTELRMKCDEIEAKKNNMQTTISLLQDDWKSEFQALKDIRQLLTQGGTKAGEVGETVLETILESAGLKKIIEKEGGVGQFFVNTQVGESGLRPDIVLFLPENKRVVIDSKISLVAYTKYLNAISEGVTKEEINRHKSAHHDAVKKHIDDLASKKYHDLLGNSSLEMTVMFMASEGAYIEAPHKYSNYVYKQKVAMVGPTTLMPIIKIISLYWKMKEQNDNVSKIIDTASEIVKLSDDTANEYTNMYKALDKFFGQVKTAGNRLVRLNDKATKMSKMGISVDVKKHEIDKLDLDDTGTNVVKKESE